MFIGKRSLTRSAIRLHNFQKMNYNGIHSKMNNFPILERVGFHSIKNSRIYNKDISSPWKLRNTSSKDLPKNITGFPGIMDIRANSTSSSAGITKMGNLSVFVEDGLRVINFDRPKKKNAITQEMYRDIPLALKEAAEDDSTVITVLTGKGDYYTSGNDLTSFAEYQGSDVEKSAHDASILLRKFVSSFIEFPKILVAAVNGPAIGIGVTTLALCDAVYASDRAFFHTPFTALGQSAEGCSTYTFPKIMGMSKASELLYFNRKITAHEAKDWGLVSKVFPHETFQEEVFTWLRSLTKLPLKSMMYTKAISRQWDIEDLRKANKMECERLKERWVSEDCINAVMGFLTRRSKM